MAGSLGQASNANATCVGISGINIGSGCQSTFGSIAIGIGNGAVAYALGPLNLAVTLGNESRANAYDGVANLAIAFGEGAYASADRVGNLAVAVGNEAAASAGGVLNFAVALGDPGVNAYHGFQRTDAFIQGTLNVAVGLFGGSSANASGLPNLSVAIGGGYASAGGLQIKLALPGQVNGQAGLAVKRPQQQAKQVAFETAHRSDHPASTKSKAPPGAKSMASSRSKSNARARSGGES